MVELAPLYEPRSCGALRCALILPVQVWHTNAAIQYGGRIT